MPENDKTTEPTRLEKKLQRRQRSKSSSKLGYLFLLFGIIALLSSLIYESSILAFIGLSLTLWGGLFLFAKPDRYVKEDILDSTTISSLTAIDKVLTELKLEGKGVYLPPRHLKEFKESVVFVPARKGIRTPPTKGVTSGKALLNPEGVCLTPPGQGLLTLYEKKLGTDLSKTSVNYLKNNLPKILIEDLEILEDLEIDKQGNEIYVKMEGSVYENLCTQVRNRTKICSRIGCPLCSSIASALAKATGKPVVIEKDEVSSDGKTVKTWYRIVED